MSLDKSSPYTSATPTEEQSPENPEPVGRVRSYVPGRSFWIAAVVSAIGIAVIQSMQIDLAIANIVTLLFLLLCLFLFTTWFVFRSAYPTALRWLLPTIMIILAVALPMRYRIASTSGSLIPEIVPRNAPMRDETMETEMETETANVPDFATVPDNAFSKFLGPNGNSRIDNVGMNTDWAANPPQELWRREIGAGWSSFAAANGFAVTMEQRGEQEMVTCYEIATGKPAWSHSVQTRHQTVLGYIGPRSTPTIHGGRVYAFGATGVARCLNGADGAEVWTRNLFEDYGMDQKEAEAAVAWGRSNSPLVVDNMAVFAVGGPRKGKRSSLVAVDAATGETVWEGGSYQASYASPMVGTVGGIRQIISVNQDFITGHDIATGEVLWEHDWPGKSYANANVSQPHVVGPNEIFISKGYGTGAQLFELIPDKGGLWDVEVIWENGVMKTKFSNAAIRDGYVYGLDDGVLSCVELETGRRAWKKGRYNYGQILMVDDVLLVMAEEGQLAVVPANPDGYEEVATIQALNGQTWNNICIAGDILLVRNSEEAAAFRLPK